MLDEELAKTYRELLDEWKELCLTEEKQKKTISGLLLEKEKLGLTIAGIEEEVTLLKYKLVNMTKLIYMLNNGYDMLDEILDIRENKTIGLEYSSMNKKVKFSTKKFVTPENKIEFLMKNHMS